MVRTQKIQVLVADIYCQAHAKKADGTYVIDGTGSYWHSYSALIFTHTL